MTTSPPSDSRPSLWQRALRRLGRTLDYRCLHWHRLGEHQQADYLRRLFELLDIDLVIDVGANRGQYADFIRRRVGYRGALLSFEPIPSLAQELAQRAAGDPNWRVRATALGACAQTRPFHVAQSSPMSSLLAPSARATSRLAAFNTVQQTLDVDVETLDAALADFPHCRNLYLKLDVQGYERQVLDGATASLPRLAAMQAELSVVPLYEGQPHYLDLLGHLESLGYLPSLIPAHNPEHFPLLIDFDCHLVRRERLADLGALNRA
ncbi:MAG: FkbM family methyltransferase [Comamonadaceae bacterium]|jgi:FkbM family methyltransferase|nr:FkbM family methyltransferase [Comamonadaceae bacterium]